MPDTEIERTIYKLELDGSAYIAAVDKVAESTNKLSDVQGSANKELADLKAQQLLYKKELDSLTTVIKNTQTEILELTKKLADLKTAEKNAATGSKEFRDDTDKTSVSVKNLEAQLQLVNGELANLKTQQANYRKELSTLNATIKSNEAEIASLKTNLEATTNALKTQQSVTASVTKTNEAANKKLIELRSQEAFYKAELIAVNAVIKANEKETLELTKRLNELKAAEKGGSAEAKNLQAQLRAISTNTKEFKIEAATLKTNLNSTTNAIKLQTKELAATESATGKATSGFTKAYSGLRTLANIIPGIGIGGLVLLIAGPLVNAVTNWISGMDKANFQLKLLKANQANLNDVMEDASKSAGKQITDLKILYQTATNVNLSIEERRKAVVALQREFPDYFGNISAETILNGKATDQYNALAAAILQTARATAAKTKLDELEAKQLEEDFNRQKVINATNQELAKAAKAGGNTISVAGGTAGGTGTEIQVSAEENRKLLANAIKQRRDARLAEIDENKKLLQDQEDFLIKFAGLTSIAKVIEDDDTKKFKGKKQKQTKDILNIYEQELQKLKSDIAKLDEKGFTDEATITKAIEEDFKKRSDAFDKAFKNKQLTSAQLASLQGYLKNLSDLTLNQSLKSFREQRQAYLQAINDEIISLQNEESTKRIQALQNSFERERQTIINETEKTTTSLEQKRDARITQLLKDAAKNGLKPEDLAPQIALIKSEYEKLLNDLQIIKNQKLQQLSFETFEALTEDAKRALDAENLGISQGSLVNIQKQATLFQQGKITFKEYQQALTEIARAEANERFNVEKSFLQLEIKIRQDKLATDKTLTDDQIVKLKDEIRKLQQQLADAEKGNITSNTTDPAKDNDKLQKFQQYADAIGSLTQSIISFWQQSNEAEQKALDYSIGLQEKRVDAAQRIAERGNAQYLKQEQDRLNDLNVQRENAARKQLGIDAALQASQILVGITGAISKIATPGIGAAETIAEIAVIIGALATGYGLVKSLQGNQPKLYKGTKYLERNGNPSGKDTIPVMANEGEAVIPTETNKKYHPAISAIYDETIPAEDLNNFVNLYHKIKPVAQPDYVRIKEAAVMNIERDGKMSVLLSENNKKLDRHIELQETTIRYLKNMGVNVSLDKNGFAVSQMEAIEQLKRSKYK